MTIVGCDTRKQLMDLNLTIARTENIGNSADSRAFFQELLAPVFAFARANGETVDRTSYLESLRGGGDRETKPESIEVLELGQRSVLVTCLVTMTVDENKRTFRNARLFVRAAPGHQWRLLSWANEEA